MCFAAVGWSRLRLLLVLILIFVGSTQSKTIEGVEAGQRWLAALQAATTAEPNVSLLNFCCFLKKRLTTLLPVAVAVAVAVVMRQEWIRAGWLTKKGKKRWFLLAGGELQWFGKEMERTTSETQVRFWCCLFAVGLCCL